MGTSLDLVVWTRSRFAALSAERAVLGEVWSSDEAYRNLLHLCDVVGDRFGGSASERQGGECGGPGPEPERRTPSPSPRWS